MDLHDLVAATAAAHGFSGAARVSPDFAAAFGEADRAAGVANTVDTRFGIASGTKLVTALAAGSLIDEGRLALDDRVVDLVPGVAPGVTIDHLLTHTSGVYDYLDEDVVANADDFTLPLAPDTLLGPRDYLPMLFAGPAKFAPGARFSYSNGGYVLLGIALEVASGRPFHALVEERVLRPCGMADSGFFRLDALPTRAAIGYVDRPDGSWRTNESTLPIVGGPDGGMFATVGDIERLWRGVFANRVLSPALTGTFLAKATRTGKPDSDYGRGMWIRGDVHSIVGSDAGVSFRSSARADGTIFTVVSNTSRGAWPMAKAIDEWIQCVR
jgi:CubicO group peptidase (beta-lactamase class C family)